MKKEDLNTIQHIFGASGTAVVVLDNDFIPIWNNKAADNSDYIYPFTIKKILQLNRSLDMLLRGDAVVAQCFSGGCRDLMLNVSAVCDGYLVQSAQIAPNNDGAIHVNSNSRALLCDIFSLLPAVFENMEHSVETLRYFDRINTSSYELLRTVQNMTELSHLARSSTLQSRKICVSTLLENLIYAIIALCPLNARFTINSNIQQDIFAFGDPQMLISAFLNILLNSFIFAEDENKINVALKTVGNTAVITVSDNGKGIRPEVLPHVFEPFYSVDSYVDSDPRPGVGLGLAIVHAVAGRFGGTASIHSRFGEGTTVAMSLMLADIRQKGEDLFSTDTAEYITDKFSPIYVQFNKFCRRRY